MTISVKTYKCPSCGANVDVKDSEKEAYCSYCGTKIKVQNDNEIIINHVDAAEMKKHDIELEKMNLAREERIEAKLDRQKRLKTAIVLFILAGIFLTISFALKDSKTNLKGLAMGMAFLSMLSISAACMVISITDEGKDNRNKFRRNNTNEISDSSDDKH